MRTLLVLFGLAFATFSVQAQHNVVLELALTSPQPEAIAAFAARFEAAAQHNARALKMFGPPPRTMFVLWVEADHIMRLTQVPIDSLDTELQEGPPGTEPVLIADTSPIFGLAKQALSADDPAEAAEELGLVPLARQASNVVAARWP